MRMSLVLFTIAKHLNMAAIELEDKEMLEEKYNLDEVDKKEEKIVSPAVDNLPPYPANMEIPPVIPEMIQDKIKEEDNGNKSSKETSEERSKETSSESSSKEVSSKKSEVKTKKAPAKKEPLKTVNVPQRTLTLDIVRGTCKRVIDEKGRMALETILKKYKALKTSDLPASNYEDVMKDCAEVLGEAYEF